MFFLYWRNRINCYVQFKLKSVISSSPLFSLVDGLQLPMVGRRGSSSPITHSVISSVWLWRSGFPVIIFTWSIHQIFDTLYSDTLCLTQPYKRTELANSSTRRIFVQLETVRSPQTLWSLLKTTRRLFFVCLLKSNPSFCLFVWTIRNTDRRSYRTSCRLNHVHSVSDYKWRSCRNWRPIPCSKLALYITTGIPNWSDFSTSQTLAIINLLYNECCAWTWFVLSSM